MGLKSAIARICGAPLMGSEEEVVSAMSCASRTSCWGAEAWAAAAPAAPAVDTAPVATATRATRPLVVAEE